MIKASIVTCISILVLLSPLATGDLADNEIGELRVSRCLSSNDCPSKCSVMGMQRFSMPECGSLGRIGDPCRPFSEPDNKTLHFPDMIMQCEDVYMQFCPCARGLVCDTELYKCKIAPRKPKQTTSGNQHRLSKWAYPRFH